MAALSYPGVYIEEVPSGVRTITGVATSITAFVGRARRGALDTPVRINSYSEYQRIFGGLWQQSPLSYAVSQFFQNGGRDALIVRVFRGVDENGTPKPAKDSTATISVATGEDTPPLILEAASPGAWGNSLRAVVDYDTADTNDTLLFNLQVQEMGPDGKTVVASETFRNVSVTPEAPRFVDSVLAQQSALARVRQSAAVDQRPTPGTYPEPPGAPSDGSEGTAVKDDDIASKEKPAAGLYALDQADLFNLLCIPPLAPGVDLDDATWSMAAEYCSNRRAVLIVDPKVAWAKEASKAEAGFDALRAALALDAKNAAAYFPLLRAADPLRENALGDFAPCGAVAGIIARTDATRGVWKAPAGLDAALSGVSGFSCKLTDQQNGVLNQKGLNCLRTFASGGNVVWGARSGAGADALASEWKYLPVRRLALFIEESLFRGTQWAVFEPNDESLWAQVRLNLGSFMHTLFRQGAFQGSTPKAAYFVKCDAETTTQNDIDLGILNILVGFAPLKPAEFVVLRLQQIAGQLAA
jgi:phage tail sheath protein FI